MTRSATPFDTDSIAEESIPSTSSPRLSINTKDLSTISSTHDIPLPPTTISERPVPSLKLLFSFLTPGRKLTLLAPAGFSSVIAGGIAPFMTHVIGEPFNAFTAYPLTPNPPQSAKHTLLHTVGLAAIQLVALGFAALLMSSLTSSLWIWTGEHNVVELRKRVYDAVTKKDMVWFDLRMGADGVAGDVQDTSSGNPPIGAGGLMATFARETDDVRAASSLASGQLIQYLTTTITCLILAFIRSPLLTLVILSAVPALIIIQGFSQAFAGPRLARERTLTAGAATLVERTVTAISTVKAFNAAAHEQQVLSHVFQHVSTVACGLVGIWGATTALSQFTTMAMFVQGFWYGAHLVREHKNTPGDVMSVFWACLIATSNLQMSIPLLVVLAKGKAAAAELVGVIESEVHIPCQQPSTPSSMLTLTPIPAARRKTKGRQLRKIYPRTITGELAVTSLSFAYPARPGSFVLHDVSMYLPAYETTFIVGPSGSGKSTMGAILMGTYTARDGEVLLDEQDVRYIDNSFLQRHIAGVSQGAAACPVFAGSLHDNVAVGAVGAGRSASSVTRAEVEEACRVAMLESWVLELEAGYDTLLSGGGGEGIQLSGGQRQRLAIARARVRDPDVLILDEATSALDPPTRSLVMAAIRCWRQNRTTIIITHDLSNIGRDDFVYVMREGGVSEQGYRADIERVDNSGDFVRMLTTGGISALDDLPPYDDFDREDVGKILAAKEEAEEEEREKGEDRAARHFSIAPALAVGGAAMRPVTMTVANWMFDAVAELTRAVPPPALPTSNNTTVDSAGKDPKDWRVSRFVPADAFSNEVPEMWRKRRPSSMTIIIPELAAPPKVYNGRPLSLQFTPTSTTFSHFSTFSPSCGKEEMMLDDQDFNDFKTAVQQNGQRAMERRTRQDRMRHTPAVAKPLEVVIESTSAVKTDVPQPGILALLRTIYPTIPSKPMFFLGLVICLISGAMTPIFSFLLSKLMYEVSAGASDARLINSYGVLVLGIAAVDGTLLGLKYFIMESTAMRWVTHLREMAFKRVTAQDKKWFDRAENGPARITQVLVKDGDDARTLVAVVFAQSLVVIAMVSVGLLWAMAWGWQLTLVGLAIAPVFVGVMALQTSLVSGCEVRNKRAREEVARVYYESILNVRGIRAMALEPVLQEQFDKATSQCLSTGVRGAFVEGCSHGVASALIYLAEALLFYVAAVLMVDGKYTYLQMVQTLNLVVFTVTIGSQLMAFTQRIAKSVQATKDLNELLKLDFDGTSEARGILRPKIEGDLVFNNVSFSYPSRPGAPVLNNLSMNIADGECVAIVGASGCGKSTIAAMLQRLYEPDSGAISMGLTELRATDVKHLRDHVAVVSQNPNLFDASIRENIAYGRTGNKDSIAEDDVVRAAQAANVHDFIISLPQGYDTLVGENASLISGGQAQRLQIARALARPAKILILDECTSALDPANQTAVLDTIRGAKVGRTTIMITHKVPVMKMCDRILVIEAGAVREHGTYESLMQRKGVFAKLANGGEWMTE